MARKEPELFYHPVVGAMSPASMMLFNLNAFQPPSRQKTPSHSSAPDVIPTSSTALFPVLEPHSHHHAVMSQSAPLAPYAERKAMTLTKTATCAITGQTLPQNEMIRFVISPDYKVVADLTGKLPGTFLWVSAERSILKKAIWRNCFTSHARQAVEIPENLLETIETGLKKLAIQTLSMSKRAGELTFGFSRTDEALRSHNAGVYVVASDSSENGREKLERLAIHQNIPVIDCWTCAEISTAIGEENTNHMALANGAMARNFLELITKLNYVRSEK